MKGEVKIETRAFEAALRNLAKATGKSFRQVVDQNSRLIAINLAHQTQPFGMDSGAKKAGEGAVMRDIGRVYKPASQVFEEVKEESAAQARGFYAAVKSGNYSMAEDILKRTGIKDRNTTVGEFEPSVHGKWRNRRGTVNRHRAALIVPKAKDIKNYAKEVARRVGIAKSGWIAAGLQLGRLSRVPAWIKRHTGTGNATRRGGEVNPSAKMNNNVRYISDVLKPDQIATALRIQREKMEAHIRHVVAYAGRKAGFKATGNQGQQPPQP